MRQAQARKSFDTYLDAPKRSERAYLHVVEDLREEAPAVEIPDWAEPFADPRWDDRLGEQPYTDDEGRRTVVVTGRPGMLHQPLRERTPGTTARVRRHTPTRARLAGRPDRVALWAVGLALVLAGMAAVTGNGHPSHNTPQPAQPSVLER
jgi:hypothetical protein